MQASYSNYGHILTKFCMRSGTSSEQKPIIVDERRGVFFLVLKYTKVCTSMFSLFCSSSQCNYHRLINVDFYEVRAQDRAHNFKCPTTFVWKHQTFHSNTNVVTFVYQKCMNMKKAILIFPLMLILITYIVVYV